MHSSALRGKYLNLCLQSHIIISQFIEVLLNIHNSGRGTLSFQQLCPQLIDNRFLKERNRVLKIRKVNNMDLHVEESDFVSLLILWSRHQFGPVTLRCERSETWVFLKRRR